MGNETADRRSTTGGAHNDPRGLNPDFPQRVDIVVHRTVRQTDSESGCREGSEMLGTDAVSGKSCRTDRGFLIGILRRHAARKLGGKHRPGDIAARGIVLNRLGLREECSTVGVGSHRDSELLAAEYPHRHVKQKNKNILQFSTHSVCRSHPTGPQPTWSEPHWGQRYDFFGGIARFAAEKRQNEKF